MHLPVADVILVGCGGTGAFVAQCLAKSCRFPVVLMDKDVYEKKNLDRQLHDDTSIGKYKCYELFRLFHANAQSAWSTIRMYLDNSFSPEGPCLFICAADNHPARVMCLQKADECSGYAIIAGNETIDADAAFYHSDWNGGNLDPRIYMPGLLSDHSGDPLMPCTGDALKKTPQLAIANMMSASLSMWLFHFYTVTAKTLSCQDLFPVRVCTSSTRMKVTTIGEMNEYR